MAPSRGCFSPEFIQEQDFQGAISSQLTMWVKIRFLLPPEQ
jgi:hypothetical protein